MALLLLQWTRSCKNESYLCMVSNARGFAYRLNNSFHNIRCAPLTKRRSELHVQHTIVPLADILETVVVQNASLRSKRFLSQSSDSLCACSHPKSKSQPEISEPLNLEESVYTAHLSRDPLTISSSPYAPQADANPLSMSRRPHSDPEDSMSSCVSEDTLQAESQDTKATIQAYTDKVKYRQYFCICSCLVPSPLSSVSWCLIMSPGVSWRIMVYHGVSWCIMAYHGVSWCIMAYHGIS